MPCVLSVLEMIDLLLATPPSVISSQGSRVVMV